MTSVAVFHGSPRKGNTYHAAGILLNELSKLGEVRVTEFFLPKDLPVFCTGCQLCLGGPNERCPHADYVTPILEAILKSDALIFTTPHFGACAMSGAMKNLLDHLDFLSMTVSPRAEIFNKKALILSTGTGSAAAVKPIKEFLKNWGVNRVLTLGFRMFTDKWDKMPEAKRAGFENKLRVTARRFYRMGKRRPYLSTVAMYYINRFILKKYIREGSYPYEYWKERGYFDKRPF